MPYTLRNLKEDLEDLGSNFAGAPNLGEDPREDVEGQRNWWADAARRCSGLGVVSPGSTIATAGAVIRPPYCEAAWDASE